MFKDYFEMQYIYNNALLLKIILNRILGIAGTDYSVYASVPETGFDCNAQEFAGIYSDTEADCQVKYLTNFLCTNSMCV